MFNIRGKHLFALNLVPVPIRSVVVLLGLLLLPVQLVAQPDIRQLRQGSVWEGTLAQEGKDPYPMRLTILSRQNDEFEARTFYSTLNGALKASGTLVEGKVLFREHTVLSGRVGVGYQYSGTIERSRTGWRFSGVFRGPDNQKGTFDLRLTN
jgi:hypothetical protein